MIISSDFLEDVNKSKVIEDFIHNKKKKRKYQRYVMSVGHNIRYTETMLLLYIQYESASE